MTPTTLTKTTIVAARDTGTTAVIYLRVSSGGQVNKAHDPEGYSIPTQREGCLRHAERLGARVVAEYPELGRTATNLQRPALQQMLADLPKLKPTYVIFFDLSRWAKEERDAFWLLAEIKRHGAKLESTLERIDDSPTGLLLYTIMAGVNAFRSRGDGEKVKGGLARKHADGGTIGQARIGYLNDTTMVEGRKVASISVDPDRAHHVQLAFDLAATGDHSITTITDVLEDAGLRTRATLKRPSHPLSRSMVHRILRDDYYTGIVTMNGVKNQGRHEPLIDPATFERVQRVLDAHRLSGDRTHKHHHYLKGTLFCACGKRLGYGRHRGRLGGIYEYFSCLSRVQRGGRCPAPYFPVERTERAVVRRYKRETLSHSKQARVRQALRAYVEGKAEIAKRASERHQRRLRELTGQQQKLLQLFYNGGVSEEVMKAEQQRIQTERTKAQQWADAATAEVEDVMGALEDALVLLDERTVIYETLENSVRRLVNQAIFLALTVRDPDTIEAKLTPLYEAIARVLAALEAENTAQTTPRGPKTPRNGTRYPQNDPNPDFRGRGSYFVKLAGATGLEPTCRWFLAPSLPSDMPVPRTPITPSKLFETRSHAWREAGLLRQIDPRVVRRARLEAFVLIPLFVAVVVLYDNRVSLLGVGRHPTSLEEPLEAVVRVVTVLALVILGWAVARDIGRSLGPPLFRRLEPATAGTVGFLIRLVTIIVALVVALRVAGIEPKTLALGTAFTAVIFGLAAQQTFGNLIAGMVLLSARPFRVGERVRLQGGNLAGQIEGTVSSLGLLYTTFATGEDSIMVPNSVVLNVAVLPLREPEAVNLRARLRAGMTPADLQEILEGLQTPLRDSPRITLEELDGEEVVVLISATPRISTQGRTLASELLEIVSGQTRSAVEQTGSSALQARAERSPAP